MNCYCDLYLEKIGLNKPTIVKRINKNGEIERLESRRLRIYETVKFWKRCFNIIWGEKIILHCSTKDYRAMSQKALPTCSSVIELFEQAGVTCVEDKYFKETPAILNTAQSIVFDLKNYIKLYGFVSKYDVEMLMHKYGLINLYKAEEN